MVLRHRRTLIIHQSAHENQINNRDGEGKATLTLFTKSNLAKLAGPVLPYPVSNTGGHNNRNRDREEDAPSRRPMLLSELVAVSGARQGIGLVEFDAAFRFASGAAEAAIARWWGVLDSARVFLAEERVVWWWHALD